MVEIRIPMPLRRYAEGTASVELDAGTIGTALDALTERYPQLRPYLFASAGQLRPFVNLFVDGEDIRMLDGLETPLAPRGTVEILPAIAGGSGVVHWQETIAPSVTMLTPASLAHLAGDPVLVDVRSGEEWAQGYLPGAIHIDRGFLEMRIADVVRDPERAIVCYCQSGARSQLAASALAGMGYVHVYSLDGGIERWKEEDRAITVPERLSPEYRQRYQRHLAIPEVGEAGQAKLARGRVAIVGLGGLGCPLSIYLAAAGVGTLALIDNDRVDLSNLQRQILYTPDIVGRPKAACAEAVLARFNPALTLVPIDTRLDERQAPALFAHYDVIVDCTDNFSARYVINDAAVAVGKPVVHGAVYRFDAQVSVFGLPDGPCYRCFLPEPPPPELAPSCAEAGVLGVLPGTAAMLMATETLKLLAGFGEPLSGRMSCYDALSGSFREIRFRRNLQCPQCGDVTCRPAPPKLQAIARVD